MALRDWVRPPRRLLTVVAAILLVPAAVVLWLGARLLQQDRALEAQRTRERIETAADLIAAALHTEISELEQHLDSLAASTADPGAHPFVDSGADDAVTVIFSPRGVEPYPAARLAYYPAAAAQVEAQHPALEAAEALEFRQNDPTGAIRAYRKLAEFPEPTVRAAALLSLARNLRKAGDVPAAVAAYGHAARLGPTRVRGLPAELVARAARSNLLAQLGRISDSRREAEALYSDLRNARWRLNRPAFLFYAQEIHRLTGAAVEPSDEDRLALATGVEELWREWERIQRGEGERAGRRTRLSSSRWLLLVWRSSGARTAAVVAGPRFVQRQWLDPTARRLNVSPALSDTGGQTVAGALPAGSHQTLQTLRAAADTLLPWNLRVADAAGPPKAGRSPLLAAGFALMALTVLAASYFAARAVARELQVAQLKADFVAAVSHEFRTPLTSMCQLAELFEQDRVADERQRLRYYGLLGRETRRLRRLVESLLDFARMEGGARQYQLEPLEAEPMIRAIVAEFREEVATAGHRIELDSTASGLRIRADEEALRRALWNLLDNAVKYSPEGPLVRVEAARDCNRLRLAVRDQGFGIPASEQAGIFRKFVRGSSSGASGAKGTGIGLAVVAHIVRGHGGSVTVESEPGRGSTFTIFLPLEE